MASIVATRLRGLFNRRRDDDAYLFLLDTGLPVGFLDQSESDDDDTSSITSHSTFSTVDDNPGTGRVIDKHLYQKFGRTLERVIFRIKLPSLLPAQISRFFMGIHGEHNREIRAVLIDETWSMKCILYCNQGKSKLYGLKCLVKQTE